MTCRRGDMGSEALAWDAEMEEVVGVGKSGRSWEVMK
jgi:hypothetical protein